jgi:hypothetical protein
MKSAEFLGLLLFIGSQTAEIGNIMELELDRISLES